MSLLLSYLGAIAGCATVKSYAATVNELAGGGPFAYWRLGTTAQVTDEIGTRHGAYTGTVVLAGGLPSGSDGAVDFAGVGQGSVTHDPLLALPAFTVSFWFRVHSYPDPDITTRMVLLSKDQAGLTDGDFNVTINDEGILLVQFQSSTQNINLQGPAIEVETPHHLVVRADGTGFDAYLDGAYLGKNTAWTDGWTANTQPIRFASAPWSAINGDVILDEVALYDRVLAQAEVIQLAQKEFVAPAAMNDSVAVFESETTPIDVTLNDVFVGTKAALTVEVVGQPGGGDSVAVDGNNDIAYTAGAVTQNTARSFTYRITDANGQSNTATVSVTVVDAVATVSNANCFVIGSGGVVSSMAALQDAVNNADPGDNILIAPGTYSGGTLTFNNNGTQANPIVIRPQNGIGTVTINGGSWTILAASSRLVLSSIFFNNGSVKLGGDHNRITRCRWQNFDGACITVKDAGGARDCRIDHCEFGPPQSGATHCTGIETRGGGEWAAGTHARLLVDYCYWHGPGWTGHAAINGFGDGHPGVGGYDIARGESITVDHCLFDSINGNTTSELMLMKHGGAITRFSTFLNCDMYLQFRGSRHCELRSCWIENCRDTKAWGEDHLVIGNRFIAGSNGPGNLWVPAGNGTWESIVAGGVTDLYRAAKDSTFIGNRFGTGHLQLGEFWANNTSAFLPADNNLLEANTRDSGGNAHESHNEHVNPGHINTTINASTNEPFTPAVKLTSSDVGLNAPDTLCG